MYVYITFSLETAAFFGHNQGTPFGTRSKLQRVNWTSLLSYKEHEYIDERDPETKIGNQISDQGDPRPIRTRFKITETQYLEMWKLAVRLEWSPKHKFGIRERETNLKSSMGKPIFNIGGFASDLIEAIAQGQITGVSYTDRKVRSPKSIGRRGRPKKQPGDGPQKYTYDPTARQKRYREAQIESVMMEEECVRDVAIRIIEYRKAQNARLEHNIAKRKST